MTIPPTLQCPREHVDLDWLTPDRRLIGLDVMTIDTCRELFADALAYQEREWVDDSDAMGPNRPLLALHERVASTDLADLWAEFAGGSEDERILLTRVCGEAVSPLPDAAREGLLNWARQPVEPPLLTWVIPRLGWRPEFGDVVADVGRGLLGHADDEVRYVLTGLLGSRLPHDDAVEGLLALSEAANPDVRHGALFELHESVSDAVTTDRRVDAALSAAASDDDARVRAVVASG